MSNNHDEFSNLTLKLRQHYQVLDGIVDSLNEGAVDSIESISEQMKLIKQTEQALVPLRAEFRKQGCRLSDALQTATDQTIELVKGLMPKLAQLEKSTLESAQRLFPKVQESVRAVQMQNAYRASHRAG